MKNPIWQRFFFPNGTSMTPWIYLFGIPTGSRLSVHRNNLITFEDTGDLAKRCWCWYGPKSEVMSQVMAGWIWWSRPPTKTTKHLGTIVDGKLLCILGWHASGPMFASEKAPSCWWFVLPTTSPGNATRSASREISRIGNNHDQPTIHFVWQPLADAQNVWCKGKTPTNVQNKCFKFLIDENWMH